MLDSFKRLFSRPGNDRDLTPIADWAKRRGHGFKRARGEDGFVIDGVLEGRAWRLEWGPSQRHYIEGHELRLRMELALPSDMQMLLLSRPLMDALERLTFEEFTDDVQTQIGTKTPEEMRWLVMFPKVNLGTMKTLRARFGAVASVPASGLAWIEGPLAHQLEAASTGLLLGDPPFVLMTLRGRSYLRLQLAAPAPADVDAALVLFETAVTQALRVSNTPPPDSALPEAAHDWGATGGTTAWQNFPDEPLPLPLPPPAPKRR
ncbi:MAG TPA: hypothetical protein VNU71_02350 [Burkholderiaceae bacterium]|nr:hypothetical protein [Burkholderiaceae bacterium]